MPWTFSKDYVNFKVAMSIATFKTCVRVIAETVATLPCILYEPTAKGGKQRALGEPEYEILKSVVNEWGQTATMFWETLVIHAASTGNGYAWIERQTRGPGAGRVKNLWNLNPDSVEPKRKGNMLYYEVRTEENTRPIILFPGEILHLANFSGNGVVGMSPLEYHRETLLTSRRQTEWQDKFFSQGIMPSGVLETDEDLGKEEREDIAKVWNEMAGGSENAHKAVVLPFGLQYKQVTMKSGDVEITKQHNLTEKHICGIMRVPPPFVQNHDKSTYTNAEQLDLALVKHCIRPWVKRIEQCIEAQLLTAEQRLRGLFVKFNLDALYRGNLLERYQAHNIAIVAGFKTRNEVRAEEDHDPIDGLDEPLVPLNMMPASMVGMDLEGDSGEGEEGKKRLLPMVSRLVPLSWWRNQKAIAEESREFVEKMCRMDEKDPAKAVLNDTISVLSSLVENEYRQIHTKEKKQVLQAINKSSLTEFDQWLRAFTESQEQYYRKNLTPVMQRILKGQTDATAWVENNAELYGRRMKLRLRSILVQSKDWDEFIRKVEMHYRDYDGAIEMQGAIDCIRDAYTDRFEEKRRAS